MNSDLQSESIKHFCPYGCCTDALTTLRDVKSFVCWALIPFKCPVYSRKDWRQSDDAVDWVGILCSHHNLLLRGMEKYTKRVKQISTGEQQPATAIKDDKRTGWSSDSESMADGTKPQPLSNMVQEEQANGDSDDGQPNGPTNGAEVDPPQAEAENTTTDWAKWNEKNKTDMASWVCSDPYQHLVLLREVLAISHSLFAKFFLHSGAKWNARQEAEAAKGNPRSFRVLEAAKGKDLEATMKSLVTALQEQPTAMGQLVKAGMRSLRFRMLVAFLCALHQLLRVSRQGFPYRLFLLLEKEDRAQIDQTLRAVFDSPLCLCDPLTEALKKRCSTLEQLASADTSAILESLAAIYEIDIASIEAAHSTTREFWKLRSRGWTPSLEAVSAKFSLRFSSLAKKDLGNKTCTKKGHQRTKKAKIARGGGAWRAFVHDKAAGRQLNAELSRELATQYHALPEKEKELYIMAGHAATVAHQRGLKPFPRDRKHTAPTPTPTVRDIPQPGTTTSTGALVALDEHPRMEILQYGGPTFADRYLTFKRGLEQEVDKLLLTQRSKMSTVSGKWISLRCPSPFPMMHKMAWVRSQAMAFNVVACRQTQQLME